MIGVWLALALGTELHGQEAPEPSAHTPTWQFRGQAIGLVTHAAPALADKSRTEGYLTQPHLAAHGSLAGGRTAITTILTLEGLTLSRGELNAGIWGEGYVDRRHPHTYVHELVATVNATAGGAVLSFSLGKGFVPFGTDDPMSRPFVKYPANHHLAQILERALVIGGLRYGPALAEIGVFNGEEPQGSGDWPDWGRFGDSWAARATLFPTPGVEVQLSHAHVASPQDPGGRGFDQRKWSAAARYQPETGTGILRYGLVEWARTDDRLGGRNFVDYGSILAEATFGRGVYEVGARYERTVRPEEERLLDPFRTPRPQPDLHIIGKTRWQIVSARVDWLPAPDAPFDLRPFLELSYSRPVQLLSPSVFVPTEFYGSESLWGLSVGARLGVGPAHGRVGRYGTALPGERSQHPVNSTGHPVPPSVTP
ncbi:MAG: hypothetical protein HY701_13885 [Gemmatimonadetes bacterium]|nr:hypothetical protein [Gemmatimonadota bacterium]